MIKSPQRRVVSFELPKHEFQALEQDAAHRGLDSLHKRGREIVIERLSNLDADETNERIAAVEQELAGVKEDLAHLVKLLRRVGYAVILGSGRTEGEASDWVREHLPTRS